MTKHYFSSTAKVRHLPKNIPIYCNFSPYISYKLESFNPIVYVSQELEVEIRQPLLEVRENLASYLAKTDKLPKEKGGWLEIAQACLPRLV
jgi:hypothetical protein